MGTLLNRRRYMGGGSSLPYDAEIEYLESTGTQLINTGISGGSNAEYSITFKILSGNASWVHICGSVRHEEGAPKIYRDSNSNAWRAEWYTTKENFVNVVSDDGNIHTVQYEEGVVYTDGEAKVTIGVYGFGSMNFCIFNYLAESLAGSKINLYSATVSLDGVLVRDYIPVRVGTTGYLYDKVSGTLFGNDGTREFVLGPDKT